uniref:Uncharacterized protein n=1 Tax=Avena sativa TaxID=4498 RepID=A0ACD5YZ13_AVESA
MESNISTCAICNGDMRRGVGGGGGASGFTADCSHQFHFRCVLASSSSSKACPLCSARCREVPSFRSSKSTPPPPASRQPAQPFFRPMEPRVFDDDDPVVRAPRPLGDRHHGAGSKSSGSIAVELNTHCEYSSLPQDATHENFAVLVHARAPGSGGAAIADAPPRARAPLDLLTVLDVSGSMVGSKLVLLKQAMNFVVDSLSPADRLCVVSFSSGANRLMRLARMSESDDGKALAKRAVESLVAGGGTNIGAALRKAAKVLDDRLHRNAVASVILLSDGQDTYTVPRRGRDADYDALVPPSFAYTGGGDDRSTPVHTFGFGTDHDAAAMHTIAEATGGTFSFIENEADIQDAFAQCIGGLLSVAVQELRVDVACANTGVRVRSVSSGCYRSRIDVDGRSASIDVGDLYADEERRFLLLMDVPRARVTSDVTHLMQVSCAYRDMATGLATNVDGEDAVVLRPSRAESLDRSAEVERERVRLEATNCIAAARAAAERGAHDEAVEILRKGQRAVVRSAAARAGDSMCVELSRDLQEMRARVVDRRRYELSGRAYVLAGLSSHAQQRATSRQMSCDGETARRRAEAGGGTTLISTASFSYVTPAMMDMLDRSRRSRQLKSEERRRSGNY